MAGGRSNAGAAGSRRKVTMGRSGGKKKGTGMGKLSSIFARVSGGAKKAKAGKGGSGGAAKTKAAKKGKKKGAVKKGVKQNTKGRQETSKAASKKAREAATKKKRAAATKKKADAKKAAAAAAKSLTPQELDAQMDTFMNPPPETLTGTDQMDAYWAQKKVDEAAAAAAEAPAADADSEMS